MSLGQKLGEVALDALPRVIELLDEIISSGDQKAAAERALRALAADAADAATDAAVDEALKRGGA